MQCLHVYSHQKYGFDFDGPQLLSHLLPEAKPTGFFRQFFLISQYSDFFYYIKKENLDHNLMPA